MKRKNILQVPHEESGSFDGVKLAMKVTDELDEALAGYTSEQRLKIWEDTIRKV